MLAAGLASFAFTSLVAVVLLGVIFVLRSAAAGPARFLAPPALLVALVVVFLPMSTSSRGRT